MSTGQQFDTVTRDARGQSERRYSEADSASPRALYGITGLLLGGIGALIKKLAYPDRSEHPPTSDEDVAAAGPSMRADQDRQTGDDAELQLPQEALEHAGAGRVLPAYHPEKYHGAYAQPVPAVPQLHRLAHLPQGTTAAPSNDNATMRLPLTLPVHTSSHSGAAGVTSGANAAPAADAQEPQNDAPQPPPSSSSNTTAGEAPGSARNRAPVVSAPVNLGQLYVNTPLVIALSHLLPNASDPDGDALSVTSLTSSSGELKENGDGTWTFTPAADDDSNAAFYYTVTDGEVGTAQTANLDLVAAPIDWLSGTEADDVIVATNAADHIASHGGSDIIHARRGDDEIDAGDGDDIISGGDGDDLIFAGPGNDIIDGGAGNDIIFAGPGDDTVFGGDGDDAIKGEQGNDTISPDKGDDVVDAGPGDDTILATATTGSGAPAQQQASQTTSNLASTYETTPSPQSNLVSTSPTETDGDDILDGGEGIDTYDISPTTANAKVNLGAHTAHSDQIGHDTIINIENIKTGDGDDEVVGDQQANSIDTGDGKDIVQAEGGDDKVHTDGGDDLILATINDGNDTYDGGTGSDTYDISQTSADAVMDLSAHTAQSAEIGFDTLDGVENATGGDGDDIIIASDEQNTLTGGDGDDTFVFNSASSSLPSPDSVDTITDFEVGDKIDVSNIDAQDNETGKQNFTFKGNADKFEKSGELRYTNETRDDGEHTVVFGNTDDDLDEDFAIDLLGKHDLTLDDFLGIS